MTLKHKWTLFKLRSKLNLTYIIFGLTHVFRFDVNEYHEMIKKVDKDVLRYWRIKNKLEERK